MHLKDVGEDSVFLWHSPSSPRGHPARIILYCDDTVASAPEFQPTEAFQAATQVLGIQVSPNSLDVLLDYIGMERYNPP